MELLTVKETAQILRVSPITVRRYIASGQLAAERAGRGIRVRREAIEDFLTPVVPDELLGKPFAMDDPLWDIVGIGRSGEPTNVAEHKEEYLAEAHLHAADDDEDNPELDELLGKPFTMNDALWSIFGIGESDDPTDVSENKHKYLADAYLSDKG